MHHNEVVPLRELDGGRELLELRRCPGRIVRVVEEEEARPLEHVRRNRLQVGPEAVLLTQGQVVHVRAREHWTGCVGRIAGIGRKADVAGVEADHAQTGILRKA